MRKLGPFKANEVYLGDSLQLMPKLPAASLDLIITDPPFAIDFKATRNNYNRTDHHVIQGYREVPVDKYFEFSQNWIGQCFRILKSSGSMYVFSGWNNLKDILLALDKVGFITVNHIIWQYQFGVFTSRRFVTAHYHCLYVCKDDKLRKFFPYSRFSKDAINKKGRKLSYQDKEDVWKIKREYWHGKQKTPTKLPTELIKKLLLYSSESNDLVFDPFLGSGQVAVVSKALGRNYLGFEIVPEYFEFIHSRLAAE
jgi:site-specific DNA-methyltransferase (adenine-specific)